ncbi:MAG: hypothetical protein QOH16_354 [Gaiellaceae bacterium]|jgi:hypothetical protein|nr:hypothetical protein [Gaiellaceae bacterium]
MPPRWVWISVLVWLVVGLAFLVVFKLSMH